MTVFLEELIARCRFDSICGVLEKDTIYNASVDHVISGGSTLVLGACSE